MKIAACNLRPAGEEGPRCYGLETEAGMTSRYSDLSYKPTEHIIEDLSIRELARYLEISKRGAETVKHGLRPLNEEEEARLRNNLRR